MREVIEARQTGDWSRALKTGLCIVKKRVIGSGKKAKVIEEYEVDTSLLSAMADLEKQVAIETGQWTEKQDLSVTAEMSERSRILAKAFSLEELEATNARMLAVMEAEQRGKVVDAPIDEEPGKARPYRLCQKRR